MENITIKEFFKYVLPLWVFYVLFNFYPVPVMVILMFIFIYIYRRK